jgi:argininosuccinate synthase
VVTGTIQLKLYKGNILVAGRQSPQSLYDEAIATMEGGGSYNQTDAEGFLRIQGLPGRVQARLRPRKTESNNTESPAWHKNHGI